MSKVAICIAGEMRYWEITKNVFNSFDADIFISTWDTNDRQDNYPYKFHGNKNINNEIVDGLDNLIEAEFLPKEIESKFTFNIPKYWYLIHRCNILKNKQEVKENFKYDCVIVTRPDNVIEKNIIHGDAITLKKSNSNKPIIFSEWSFVNKNLVKRINYKLSSIVESECILDTPLFSDLGEDVYMPSPVKVFELQNYLDLKDV